MGEPNVIKLSIKYVSVQYSERKMTAPEFYFLDIIKSLEKS